jgi:hypothetical protein
VIQQKKQCQAASINHITTPTTATVQTFFHVLLDPLLLLLDPRLALLCDLVNVDLDADGGVAELGQVRLVQRLQAG